MDDSRHSDVDRRSSRRALPSSFPADLRTADARRSSALRPVARSPASTVKSVGARAIWCAAVLAAAPSMFIDRAWANDFPTDQRAAQAHPAAADPWSELLAEASFRTDLPAALLHDLMRVESGGNAFAVSPKGAIGLMQVMPATYSALRRPLGLGADPFAPRDNVLAGAMYLRLLVDRYGWPDALAAYNAGPRRLDAFLTRGRALPAKTIAYLLRFAPSRAVAAIGVASVRVWPSSVTTSGFPPLPSKPTLFVAAASTASAVPPTSATAVTVHRAETSEWRESGLFVLSNPSQAHP